MNRGFKMTGDGDGITIKKASTSYKFDQRIKSGDGELVGLKIKPKKIDHVNLHIGSTHAFLGHPSNEVTNETTGKIGLKRIHVEASCESCIKAK